MDEVRQWIRTQLWDQVPVSISVIDRGFNIIEANRSFRKQYGEWKNRPCHEVYKGRETRCESCAALDSFADGLARTREEEGVVKDGVQTYYLVQMVPLVREGGGIEHVIELSTDITATKTLEHDKLQAERLAAVGQTVAGLAHGIKNVLMGLDGGMYVIRTGIEKGDPQRIFKGWQMLDANIRRITSFVKEFLEFARGREPLVEPLDPNAVAQEVVDLFRDSAGLAQIVLDADFQVGIPMAPMDHEALRVCLENLVSNALDACQISDRPGHHVVLRTRDEGDVLVFEVEDDGSGMDYDVKKKVFTNFFSTKGTDRGTGLGLLTTRKIVQEHGGRVSFESEEGKGSAFRLEFPRNRLPQNGHAADQGSDKKGRQEIGTGKEDHPGR